MAAIYYEYTIKGNEEAMCAYLEGFLRGKGVKEGYFFSRDYPVHFHRLKEMIKYHGDTGHVICQSKLQKMIQSAINQETTGAFEIKDSQKITKASFHFEFETASRKVASTIKRDLGNLPPGVNVAYYEPEEVVNPKAKGPEGYAPLHSYSFEGEGEIEGDVAGVFNAYSLLSNNEFFDCDDIEVDH
jgi:hypothetical protein